MTQALRINGEQRRVAADPATTLLHVLRNELGLTAAHYGCGTTLCGACFVLVDGRPTAACDTPLRSLAGREIVTLEGLGTPERPHPVQQAMIDEQAMQCGYCIPGIIVSAAALLAGNPDPSDSEIRTALDPHLCRCGAHNRILRAVQRAARAG